MKNSDLLWAELEKDPENTELKRVLCDALREDGEEEEADTIQWCIDSGKWPVDQRVVSQLYDPRITWAYWIKEELYYRNICWSIPEPIFEYKLAKSTSKSSRDAILQLRDRLLELKLIGGVTCEK